MTNERLSWQETGMASLFALEIIVEKLLEKQTLSNSDASDIFKSTVDLLDKGSGEMTAASVKLRSRWRDLGYHV